LAEKVKDLAHGALEQVSDLVKSAARKIAGAGDNSAAETAK
jgi:hypothetical protein